jgi:hypothetical protein
MRTTESIEHVVLRVLQQSGCLDVATLATIVFQSRDGSDSVGPTKPEINRVRRALSLLRRQGQVFRLGRAPVNGANARPREVYADRATALAHVQTAMIVVGLPALSSRPDLLALVTAEQITPLPAAAVQIAARAGTG